MARKSKQMAAIMARYLPTYAYDSAATLSRFATPRQKAEYEARVRENNIRDQIKRDMADQWPTITPENCVEAAEWQAAQIAARLR